MDNFKDNKTQSDTQSLVGASDKNADFTRFFEKDSLFVFICKKTQKLVSAIYMVTNFFSELEPMKWTLRKKSSEFLSLVLEYKNVSKGNQKDFIYTLKGGALEIVSFLEISVRGGLVSEMNFSLLKQEFFNLMVVLEESPITEASSSPHLLSGDFFSIEKSEIPHQFSHGYGSQEISQGASDKTFGGSRDRKNTIDKSIGNGEVKKSSRQNIILSLLKKHKELSIKDISAVIKDCSEKTIQRELISFISLGVVKRTGERRWSMYSLVN
jgi:hypothetical protein